MSWWYLPIVQGKSSISEKYIPPGRYHNLPSREKISHCYKIAFVYEIIYRSGVTTRYVLSPPVPQSLHARQTFKNVKFLVLFYFLCGILSQWWFIERLEAPDTDSFTCPDKSKMTKLMNICTMNFVKTATK